MLNYLFNCCVIIAREYLETIVGILVLLLFANHKQTKYWNRLMYWMIAKSASHSFDSIVWLCFVTLIHLLKYMATPMNKRKERLFKTHYLKPSGN